MYTILFLNQSETVTCGRSYDAFLSAYCLARLGHKVLYICDRPQRFINEFYEGPVYSIDEMFDDKVDKQAAVLPPSLVCTVEKAPDKIRDFVDRHGGRPDMIWFSGSAISSSLPYQIAESWRSLLVQADTLDLCPCVNEVQLTRVKRKFNGHIDRIICIRDNVSESESGMLASAVKHMKQSPEVWIVGQCTGGYVRGRARRRKRVTLIPNTSDRGRLKAIMNSTIYLHPCSTTRHRNIAEAMACGTPVVAFRDSIWNLLDRFYPDRIEYVKDGDLQSKVSKYFNDNAFREANSKLLETYARRHFGFGNRMMQLQQRIMSVFGG